MTPLLKKMNFKGQREIVVLNAPPEFEMELAAMAESAMVNAHITSSEPIHFVLVFVTSLKEIDRACALILERLQPDALCWFAYPKGSSKKYKCEFNRDNGWSALGAAGMEGVRIVSIDNDWTALRFKPVTQIKNFTRSSKMALSQEGKRKGK